MIKPVFATLDQDLLDRAIMALEMDVSRDDWISRIKIKYPYDDIWQYLKNDHDGLKRIWTLAEYVFYVYIPRHKTKEQSLAVSAYVDALYKLSKEKCK